MLLGSACRVPPFFRHDIRWWDRKQGVAAGKFRLPAANGPGIRQMIGMTAIEMDPCGGNALLARLDCCTDDPCGVTLPR